VEGAGEEPLRGPREDPAPSGPILALVAGAGIAVVSLVLAGLAGGPYLDLSELNPWVAVFAVATFAALFSVPFAVERMLKAAHPERAEYWERAMLIWGAVATAVLLLGGLLIVAGGFSPGDSLADAAGLLLVIDAGMIVISLLAWLLAG
jgi:hypothetical protein